MKFKELKNEYPFLFPFLAVTGFLAVLALMSLLYVGRLQRTLESEVRSSLEEVARQGVKILQTQIEGDEDSLKSMATAISGYTSLNKEEMMDLLNAATKNNAFKRMAFIRPNGYAVFNDGSVMDASSQPAFVQAMQGKAALSQRRKDSTDGKEIIVQAVPVFKDGEVKGVLASTRSIASYTDILSVYSFGGQGYNVIVRSNGDKVINANHETAIENFTNIFADRDNLTWHTQEDVSKMKEDMRAGRTGSLLFTTRKGGRMYASYVPVGINDWYMVSLVPEKVLLVKTARLVWLTLAFMAAGLGLIALLLYYILAVQKSNRFALERATYEDPITGLPNWNKMQQVMASLLKANPQQAYAFVTLDVDRFKIISNIYGPGSGDELLKHISQILSSHIKEGEEFSRMETDRFQLLLKYQDEQSLRNRLELINEEIVSTPGKKTPSLRLLLSFGVYLIKDKQMPVEEMVNRSFLARRSVKYSVEAVAFFNEDMLAQANLEKRLENDMEGAFSRGEFKLMLMPVRDLESGRIVRAAARVLWRHPALGDLHGHTFRPIFERNGFARRIDMFVVEELFKLIKTLRARGRQEGPFSVTLSPLHIYNPYFAAALKKLADSYQVNPADLELDLSQNSLEHNIADLIDLGTRLQKEGFVIGVSRFGEGLSAIQFLAKVKAQWLKVQVVAVPDSQDLERMKQMFDSFKYLASALGAELEFDGVTTSKQAEFLKQNGIRFVSGSLWGDPLPAEEFLKSL